MLSGVLTPFVCTDCKHLQGAVLPGAGLHPDMNVWGKKLLKELKAHRAFPSAVLPERNFRLHFGLGAGESVLL